MYGNEHILNVTPDIICISKLNKNETCGIKTRTTNGIITGNFLFFLGILIKTLRTQQKYIPMTNHLAYHSELRYLNEIIKKGRNTILEGPTPKEGTISPPHFFFPAMILLRLYYKRARSTTSTGPPL